MVAGKERALVKKRESEMIGAMAGGSDGLDGEARPLKPLAVAKHGVGRVIAVMRGIEAAGPIPFGREGLGADDPRAGRRAKPVRKRAVIAMGMGDEDRFDRLALDRGQDRREMRLVGGARIDDRDRAVARRYRCRCR